LGKIFTAHRLLEDYGFPPRASQKSYVRWGGFALFFVKNQKAVPALLQKEGRGQKIIQSKAMKGNEKVGQVAPRSKGRTRKA